MKLEFSQQVFKNPHMKFHENPSNGAGSQFDRQTDKTDLIVASLNFVNMPKN